MEPIVLLESHNPRCSGQSFRFHGFVEEVHASSVGEVLPALEKVEEKVSQSLHAAGFITYEAATGIDPLLTTRHEQIAGYEGPTRTLPLVWFGLFREREEFTPSIREEGSAPPPIRWHPTTSRQEYLGSIARIHEYIRAGDTYQVNFTHRLQAQLEGDPWLLYRALCQSQGAGYCAYIDTGSHLVLSASPELFFSWKDGSLITRPMKGTARRGRFWLEDEQLREGLARSVKNRAENVMIVDLMRNDLGRLAEVGSVLVESLFEVERLETVFQMTSTISARIRRDVTFLDILRALFPSGSVTGAPKIRTMQIIRELESSPRGLYTGAVGYLSPGKEAVFNVAIRTVVTERVSGSMEFGLGGGITHDSQPLEEFQESLDKARFLYSIPKSFDLLESLLYERGQGFFLLERHLQRMERSAAFFGFQFDIHKIAMRVMASIHGLDRERYKVRLLLSRGGQIRVEFLPLTCVDPCMVEPAVIDTGEPVDHHNVFLFNKTTNREVYECRTAKYPEGWHVILVNQFGEVTESSTANLVIRKLGCLYTPPLEAGLLPGTYRQELLERGLLIERAIRPGEVLQSEAVYLINSVRGWIRVEVLREGGAFHDEKKAKKPSLHV